MLINTAIVYGTVYTPRKVSGAMDGMVAHTVNLVVRCGNSFRERYAILYKVV